MRRFKLMFVVFSLLLVFTGNLFAQSEATALFLLIAPGARAGGIGEANVALANDAYATFWNPAGLGKITGKQLSGMHTQWLPGFNLGDMYYDFASYVQRFEGIGTMGFNVTYVNWGDQVHTDEIGTDLGTFSSYEMAVGVSYGTDLSETFSVGSTMKYIYSRLSPYSSGEQQGEGVGSSVAVDLGLLWVPMFSKRTTIGMNMQNLGPKITYVDADQADPLPSNLKLGVAYRALESEFNKLTVTLDFNKQLVRKDEEGNSDPFYKAIFTSWTDGGFSYQVKRANIGGGAEYWYSDLFSLRAGYFYEDIGERRFATFGAGIKLSAYQFDFGYIYGSEGHPLAETMRFSLSFLFP
ncbi:PorV/PorQ family protein [candidate division KSB1 bacterium]